MSYSVKDSLDIGYISFEPKQIKAVPLYNSDRAIRKRPRDGIVAKAVTNQILSPEEQKAGKGKLKASSHAIESVASLDREAKLRRVLGQVNKKAERDRKRLMKDINRLYQSVIKKDVEIQEIESKRERERSEAKKVADTLGALLEKHKSEVLELETRAAIAEAKLKELNSSLESETAKRKAVEEKR